MTLKNIALSLSIIFLGVSSVSAAVLYSEAFESSAANVTILQQPDTTVQFLDYGNMTIGSTSYSIPESPRMITGSTDTRGVLIRANSDDATNLAAAVNIIAGNTPMSFSGDYQVSFDAYMSIDPIVDTDGDGVVDLPSGSTEQLLWGVGTSNSVPEARNTRNSGVEGTWGWLAGENGYGTEDAAIFMDGTELADLGDTQTGESVPFNLAFDSPITPGAPNNAPGNSWVEVDIFVQGGSVQVLYNGVEFFNESSSATDGYAMLGYEDPFASTTNSPDGMWGLFDNFVVQEIVPEPNAGLLSLYGLGFILAVCRRRR